MLPEVIFRPIVMRRLFPRCLALIGLGCVPCNAIASQSTWSLAKTPRTSIGSETGGDAYQFGRIVAALPMASGRVVVADWQVPTLRVYDSTGRHVTDWGRKGRGPEEFGLIDGAFAYRGDSLAIWDAENFRVSIVAPSGRIVRTIRVNQSLFGAMPGMLVTFVNVALAGTLADGRFVFTGGERTPRRTGQQRGHRAVHVLAADGARDDSVGAVPGMELTVPPNFRPERSEFWRPPAIAVHNNRIYYGNADRFEINVVDAAFKPLAKMTRATPQVPLTDQLRREHERIVAERRRVAGQQEGPPRPPVYPRVLPAFTGVHVATDGAVWVQHHWPDAERYSIFSPDGRLLAELTMQPRMRLMHATASRVVVTVADADGVGRVQVYDINKP